MLQHTEIADRKEGSTLSWLIIATAIFIVRIMPWALSEYWYDEVLTLNEFVLGSGERGLWQGVFRCYPIANNHILSTAMYWLWVRILNFNLSAEQIVRLPSIALGVCTLGLVICHWKKVLGNKLACVGGMLLAISPVFASFAYQVRGYSLSIFLATLAISGLIELNTGKSKYGMFLLCLSGLLLPLVIPSNLTLAPVLATLLLCSRRGLKSRLKVLLPPMLCMMLGGSYYLTIWRQFLRAAGEPAGWGSAWAVFFNLLLALVSFGLVIFAVGFYFRDGRAKKDDTASATSSVFSCFPRAIFWSSLGTIALTLACSRTGHAPYPRVFLPLLPFATLALLLPLIGNYMFAKAHTMILIVGILLNGLVWERMTTAITNNQLARGVSPCNLLQQYYRGSDELRGAAYALAEEKWMENSAVITDAYDFPTMNFYWVMDGGSPNAALPPNDSTRGMLAKSGPLRTPIWAVAKNSAEAAKLYEHLGLGTWEELLRNCGKEGGMQKVLDLGIRSIYAPPMQTPPPAPQKQHAKGDFI